MRPFVLGAVGVGWVFLLFACGALAQEPPPAGERLSLDPGWRFHLGDIPFPVVTGHADSYANAKAGKAWGAAAPDFDDTGWRSVDLPHDWAVEGPFDRQANLSQGYRPRGIGWYRRYFHLPATDRGRYLEVQFDGVATHCTVWINGILAHRNWCGYTSFSIDITPFAKYGDELNSIAVRVDADAMEGWWYEGAGIYRHTWLVKRSPVHLETDGVFANPVKQGDAWSIPVEATLNSSGTEAAPVQVESVVTGPDGKEAARGGGSGTVRPFEETKISFSIPVASPRLWSVDDPALYRVDTVVKQNGAVVDRATTHCGFRTLRFDPDRGFFLNGQPLKIQGTCNHQDQAGVGVAVPDSLWEYRLRKLKEMGSNAYRCAHNPPSGEFLDACDRIGMMVMDENRNFNSTPEYLGQLDWMIRRDRNHPSVILWSVFNEEPMQGTESGYEMVRRMVAEVKRLDPTRPVTAAMSNGAFNPVNVAQAVDVVGFNYQIGSYDRFHAANPSKPMTSSEDTSAFMTRGEYVTDKSRNIIDSYDTQAAPWGATHRNAWKAIAERPFLAGGFVWTGFDYRGEPTPFHWPSAGSIFGCMDLCGFPKTAFYIHQAEWIHDRPVLHLVPHWNWRGKEGRPIQVMAASNADAVALFLNGRLISELPVDPDGTVSWEVPYAPGKLEAIAKKSGREVARTTVETTDVPASLQLVLDRPILAGDGWDAEPVTVRALDREGRPVPTANLPVHFEVAAPGKIIGVGNGDPTSHEPEKGNGCRLFNGLAQVIVQTLPGSSGALALRATADGLAPAQVSIGVAAGPSRPSVPAPSPSQILQGWMLSPFSPIRPDPAQSVSDSDMNSWSPVEPGKLPTFQGGSWGVYRVRFQPYASVRETGGRLIFHGIAGKAEVWLDGKLLAKKTSPDPGPLDLELPAGEGKRTLQVLIEGKDGAKAGLDGSVEIGSPRSLR